MPGDESEVRAAVAEAIARQSPLEVLAGGSKRDYGRPVQAAGVLNLARLDGVIDYAPSELTLTARAATPLATFEPLLAGQNQGLAFEPPDLGRLLGTPAGTQTLGGVVATNLAGPRRFKAGAARDHVLGVRVVTGRGEAIKAGGKVVKNVTGYDLCKLLTGSFGTLGVLTEITVKVLPRAEKTRTLLAYGADGAAALTCLAGLAAGPLDPTGAAYLPAAVAGRSAVAYVAGAAASVTAVRVEGPAASTLVRAASVKDVLAHLGPVEELHGANSALLWREIGGGALLAEPREAPVWYLALPPAAAWSVAAGLDGPFVIDGAGASLWLASAASPRAAATAAGGIATLVRASAAARASVDVFQPLEPGLAALNRRVKEAFDPRGVLNPGRMVAGV